MYIYIYIYMYIYIFINTYIIDQVLLLNMVNGLGCDAPVGKVSFIDYSTIYIHIFIYIYTYIYIYIYVKVSFIDYSTKMANRSI
jgi:hypothetical protein